ncbi:helix-turn-helix domain-containing protein, partial [Fusicatenibacter saccharivorans]|uniref:helix-turn-helix domain-containing protein n=1 Tax=Fusicatenibacter saccharivorans TaxID=1150298 RepID=UPI00156DF4F2|nr:helix-turn-helix domain-containing protein [Fusicatenibacter saccharivorans]
FGCVRFIYNKMLDDKIKYLYKLDIENPIIRINTAFKGCSSLEKISVLPRIYHN